MIIIEQDGSTTMYINPTVIALVKTAPNGGVQITTTFGSIIPLSGERADSFMRGFNNWMEADDE